MSRYEQARDTLAEALGPVADYVQRAHDTIDAADPKQAGKLRHVTQIEAVIEAVADFGEVVDAQMSGPDWQRLALLAVGRFAPPMRDTPTIIARCQRLLAQPWVQKIAALPLAERQRRAAITSHHIPVPAHINALFPSHAWPL